MTGEQQSRHPIFKVLDAQRAALLAGNLDALEGLEARLQKALGSLAQTRPTESQLEAIRNAARHNARLLEAAKAGLAAVSTDRSARRTGDLVTYDRNGIRSASGKDTGRTFLRR